MEVKYCEQCGVSSVDTLVKSYMVSDKVQDVELGKQCICEDYEDYFLICLDD